MTTRLPKPHQPPHPAGYVPAFAGADGNEDPAPEEVVHAPPPAPAPPAETATPAGEAGQLPLDFASAQASPGAAGETAAPQLPTLGADQGAERELHADEMICPNCNGSGQSLPGVACEQCGGTGIVAQSGGHV